MPKKNRTSIPLSAKRTREYFESIAGDLSKVQTVEGYEKRYSRICSCLLAHYGRGQRTAQTLKSPICHSGNHLPGRRLRRLARGAQTSRPIGRLLCPSRKHRPGRMATPPERVWEWPSDSNDSRHGMKGKQRGTAFRNWLSVCLRTVRLGFLRSGLDDDPSRLFGDSSGRLATRERGLHCDSKSGNVTLDAGSFGQHESRSKDESRSKGHRDRPAISSRP